MGQPVRLFHEADFQQAVSLREQVEQLAQSLCAETNEVSQVSGVPRVVKTEPIDIGRRRAAVALDLVPVSAIIGGGEYTEPSPEDKLALRIRERITGDSVEDTLNWFKQISELNRRQQQENAVSEAEETAHLSEIIRLPLLPAGTIVHLNGIPLELATEVPVYGDVAFALSQKDDVRVGDESPLVLKEQGLEIKVFDETKATSNAGSIVNGNHSSISPALEAVGYQTPSLTDGFSVDASVIDGTLLVAAPAAESESAPANGEPAKAPSEAEPDTSDTVSDVSDEQPAAEPVDNA